MFYFIEFSFKIFFFNFHNFKYLFEYFVDVICTPGLTYNEKQRQLQILFLEFKFELKIYFKSFHPENSKNRTRQSLGSSDAKDISVLLFRVSF